MHPGAHHAADAMLTDRGRVPGLRATEEGGVRVVVTNPEGFVVTLNRALAEHVGFTGGKACRMRLDQVLPELAGSPLAVGLLEGGGPPADITWLAEEAERGLVAWGAASLALDRQGDLLVITGVELGPLLQAPGEGKWSALAQQTLDALSFNIAVLEADGRIIAVNEAWRRYGKQRGLRLRDAGVGSNYLAITEVAAREDATAAAVAAALSSIAAGEEERFSCEYPCHGPDERRWFIVRLTRFELEGRPRIVAAHMDITLRRLAEEEARVQRDRLQAQAAELQKLNEELRAFDYSVSHDLRGPARSIEYLSNTLLEDYGGALSPGAREVAQRIRREASRMDRLIAAFLVLSSVTRSELRTREFSLSALARDVAARLRTRDPARQVEIVVQDGLNAWGDPDLLQQAVENLMGNAWKFTARSPRARIEVGEARGPDGERIFYVRDTGIGFDMAEAEILFRPFRRLGTAKDITGSGIGLATVRRIVERHGGRVWAEGRPGEGATFYFTLAGGPRS